MPRSDFNGDGRDDFLLAATDWQANYPVLLNMLALPNANFQSGIVDYQAVGTVVGIGDFNGDGHSDLLMMDSSRTFHMTRTPHYDDPNFYRFVSYLTLDVSEIYYSPTLDWDLAGLGDFDGDGKDDILWRNKSGELSQWTATTDFQFAWTQPRPSICH